MRSNRTCKWRPVLAYFDAIDEEFRVMHIHFWLLRAAVGTCTLPHSFLGLVLSSFSYISSPFLQQTSTFLPSPAILLYTIRVWHRWSRGFSQSSRFTNNNDVLRYDVYLVGSGIRGESGMLSLVYRSIEGTQISFLQLPFQCIRYP